MNDLLYRVAIEAELAFGFHVISTLSIIAMSYILYSQLRTFKVDLSIIALALAALPMLTPYFTALFGYQYFTMLNYDLQDNATLKTAATLLLSIFCLSLYLGTKIKIDKNKRTRPIIINFSFVKILYVLVFFLLINFLEAETVVFTGYGAIKSQTTAYSSTVHQTFNLFVAVCLSFTHRRQRVIILMYALAIIFSLLVSRRTLAIGLMIAAIYTSKVQRFTPKQILMIGCGLFLVWFVGEARSQGIFSYISEGNLSAAADFFRLPGGASNVFVGTMGVIDLTNGHYIQPKDTMPILGWWESVYEGDIYARYGYDYNGGMHIANILYWNFGLIGVMMGGVCVGYIAKMSDAILKRLNEASGGTLGAMLAIGFALTLPNTIWYSPIGLLKLSFSIVIIYAVLQIISSPKKEVFYYSGR